MKNIKKFFKRTRGVFTAVTMLFLLIIYFFTKTFFWLFTLPESVSEGTIFGIFLLSIVAYALVVAIISIAATNAIYFCKNNKFNFREQIIVFVYVILLGEMNLFHENEKDDIEEFSEIEPEGEPVGAIKEEFVGHNLNQ